jgi:hypothetical protein
MTDLQDRLWIERDAVRWGGSREPGARGVVMVRPPAYPDAGRDTLDWGGTFSLDHRPNGLIANFMGYNPALMKANDYAVSTGAQKRIFRMPSDDSKDYYATGSKLIVPHGLFFSLDSRGSERKDAQTIDNERERQQMKVLGLGGNVGIPLVASFSVDGSHQEAQERVYDEQVSTVHNEAIVTHYALVLDKARMPLTRAFRTEILTLRNRMISGQGISDEDWDHFFRTFGSHFAYAVTYGGKAWTETTIDSATTTSSRSFDDKISGEASGVLDEFLSVGAKANSEYSGKTLDKDATVNERTTFGTYGGSFSKGGGWSVGRGEELPVLLDLRMITELIVPVYFDDPTVYEDLRKKMQTALDSYMGGVSDALARREATWHRNHVDVPAATDPVSQCFSEGFGELCFGVVP